MAGNPLGFAYNSRGQGDLENPRMFYLHLSEGGGRIDLLRLSFSSYFLRQDFVPCFTYIIKETCGTAEGATAILSTPHHSFHATVQVVNFKMGCCQSKGNARPRGQHIKPTIGDRWRRLWECQHERPVQKHHPQGQGFEIESPREKHTGPTEDMRGPSPPYPWKRQNYTVPPRGDPESQPGSFWREKQAGYGYSGMAAPEKNNYPQEMDQEKGLSQEAVENRDNSEDVAGRRRRRRVLRVTNP
jgi:hypothetical protein